MRINDNFRFKNHSDCNFENPAVFEYHVDNSLYPKPRPKEKTINEEGWQQFFMLCLGLLLLPSLVFSGEQQNHAASKEHSSSSASFVVEYTL